DRGARDDDVRGTDVQPTAQVGIVAADGGPVDRDRAVQRLRDGVVVGHVDPAAGVAGRIAGDGRSGDRQVRIGERGQADPAAGLARRVVADGRVGDVERAVEVLDVDAATPRGLVARDGAVREGHVHVPVGVDVDAAALVADVV